MDKITTDYLISLANMNEDSLYQLYLEAITKLRNKNTNAKDRKVYSIRVIYIRSIISDKYSLRLRYSTPSFDDPMNNNMVNRFFK